MKVDITYTNEATNRKRTLKNVTYLGRAHARAISEAREGTINFPLPVGFRLAATATGNPVLRPEDRRKIAKTLRQNKKNLMEEVTGLHQFFTSPIDIYSVKGITPGPELSTSREWPRSSSIWADLSLGV